MLQNARTVVLWDFSYIVEHAYRISLGDVPYRDFPIPHAPLTFLTQAILIRLFGAHFWVAVVYSAIINGTTTVLTFWILCSFLPRRLCFVLAIPLIVLGVYSQLCTPFYDPDACFWMMVALFYLVQAPNGTGLASRTRLLVAGGLLVIPIAVKQNLGIVFFVLTHIGLVLSTQRKGGRGQLAPRQYGCIALGSLAALLVFAVIIQRWAGLGNYVYWTQVYATTRRLPDLLGQVVLYADPILWVWLTSFAIGVACVVSPQSGIRRSIGAVLLSVPFVWSVWGTLRLGREPFETSDTLLLLWPMLMIVGALSNLRTIIARTSRTVVSGFLGILLLGVAHAAFLSQGVWGSTYGLWPLFILVLGVLIADLSAHLSVRAVGILCLVLSLSLTIDGAAYAWRNERLWFAKVASGEHVVMPRGSLKGLSARGPYLINFLELLDFAEHQMSPEDGIILLPGEDPFYFATHRRPRFPVLLFDATVNPYSSDALADLIRQRNISWVVVKTDLQIINDPFPTLNHLLALLAPDFALHSRLKGYDVYRRAS